MHYARWRRYGDPEITPPSREDLFWAHVTEDGTCWVWTGALTTRGYGKFGMRSELAHRFAYEHLIGPIPPGLELDHLCRVTKCVNPWHLDPVPQRVNLARADIALGIRSAKTHCPYGHPYDEDNTTRRNGRRHCKACARIRAARNRERKKAATA